MAGTIPLSMTQQLDEFGAPLAGGHLYLIQAGTTSTPQNGFQDSALTLPLPNPIILSASGRIPQFFLADGSIKIRLTDVNGVEKLVADGLIVTGASSGGGGGSPVDPTTIAATADLKVSYGTNILAGWVRANGRTIGSATSGASERANADCQALFQYLWGVDANLVVSGGRGASAAADWAANKTIALPDWRGRAIAGLDDMGNSAAGVLTTTFYGNSPIVLGNVGGSQSTALSLAQLPTGITVAGTVTVNSTFSDFVRYGGTFDAANANTGTQSIFHSSGAVNATVVSTGSNTLTSNNTSGSAHGILPPLKLATIYLKL